VNDEVYDLVRATVALTTGGLGPQAPETSNEYVARVSRSITDALRVKGLVA
jgi:hypothetical protein